MRTKQNRRKENILNKMAHLNHTYMQAFKKHGVGISFSKLLKLMNVNLNDIKTCTTKELTGLYGRMVEWGRELKAEDLKTLAK